MGRKKQETKDTITKTLSNAETMFKSADFNEPQPLSTFVACVISSYETNDVELITSVIATSERIISNLQERFLIAVDEKNLVLAGNIETAITAISANTGLLRKAILQQ